MRHANIPADASIEPSGLNFKEDIDIVCPPMVYFSLYFGRCVSSVISVAGFSSSLVGEDSMRVMLRILTIRERV